MITYVDTSVLPKLLVDDEVVADAAQRLLLDSDFVLCTEIGYTEARAALASAHSRGRGDDDGLATAKAERIALWAQVDVVPVTTELVLTAGDLAEADGLRGDDSVHLAASLAGQATAVATADSQLLAAARHRQLDVSKVSVSPEPRNAPPLGVKRGDRVEGKPVAVDVYARTSGL